MFNEFITWDMFLNYSTFVSLVYIFTEFTKELKFVKQMPTKYYSMIVSFLFITLVQYRLCVVAGELFDWWNVIPYLMSAIAVSLSANGLSDFNKPKTK